MSGLACPPPHHHHSLPTAWLPPAPLPAQTSCPPPAAPGRAGGQESSRGTLTSLSLNIPNPGLPAGHAREG